ncbi:MAG: hypothetical protein MSH40_05730 [Christensenella sp.]|nr:hypothetical protein [Christensenella sp.]
MTKKLKIQLSLFVVAILFNIWGILSILQVGIGINVGLTYLDKIKDFHIILCYVIIVITMAIGIMGASINAGQLDNIKVLKGLTIGITTYSTVLTIPLLLAFVCFVVYPTNVDLAVYGSGLGEFIDGMFGTIAKDLGTIFGPKEWGGFGSKGLLITVYILGIIMSIAFLAVPIISAVQAIKNANKKELNKSIEE